MKNTFKHLLCIAAAIVALGSTNKVDAQIITTVVGTGTGTYTTDGVPATGADINVPQGIAFDVAGNMYFCDWGNYRVRKVSTSGIISTIAGNGTWSYTGDGGAATDATISRPTGIALDNSGNVFFCDQDNHVIRKINTSGMISTVAGTGVGGYTFDNIPATASELNFPYYVAIDASNNLIIADRSNNRVRKVDGAGIITTIAGTGTGGFFGDGSPATDAQLLSPVGVSIDAVGNIYVAETGNRRVRKINTAGIISTFAGTGSIPYGGDGVPATAANMMPGNTSVDAAGNVFITDQSNNRVFIVNTNGFISTFAGTGVSGFSGDGGLAAAAQVNGPWLLAMDHASNFYISDQNNNRIRKITCIPPIISPISGSSNLCSGNTIALSDASLGGTWSSSNPAVATVGSTGVVTGVSTGNVVISYSVSNSCGTTSMKHIVSVGNLIVNTIAGTGVSGFSTDGGAATASQLNDPSGMVMDGSGNLYFSDLSTNRIRKISTTGILTTVAGTGAPGYLGDGGPATNAKLDQPAGIVMDASGNLLWAERNSSVIRKLTMSSGIISTITGNGTGGFAGDGGPAAGGKLNYPQGLAIDAAGNIFIADGSNNRIRKIDLSGNINTVIGGSSPGSSGDGGPASAALLDFPYNVYIDPTGNMYICDEHNYTVRKVDLTGTITRIAGTTGISGTSGDGGPATACQFVAPSSVIMNAQGDLIIGDNNSRVRSISAATGIISVIAGSVFSGYSGDGGPPTAATFNSSHFVYEDASSNIYIADAANSVIRKIYPVNASVASIAGPNTVCVGATITLSDVTPAGTWSSSNPLVASVGSSSGLVTGVAFGTANITYTVAFACGTLYSVQPVTVNASSVTPVTGPSLVCIGNTITLSNATPGGTWSSSNVPVATVGSTGVVTGVSTGNTLITYSVSGSCAAQAFAEVYVGSQIISTVAGNGSTTASSGVPATSTGINIVTKTAMDNAGNLYYGDYNNNLIRVINTSGVVSTYAGNGSIAVGGDGTAATASGLSKTAGLAFDAAGNLYFADYNGAAIRKVTPAGLIYTVAGTGTAGFSGDGGPATAATINTPWGVVVDNAGNVLFSDRLNNRIRKISTSGIITTIAGSSTTGGFLGEGTPATDALLNQPIDLTYDIFGNLYFADFNNNRVRKVDVNGMISTVAGTGTGAYSGDNNPATAAGLNNPTGVALDSAGNLYIGDYLDNRIRKVNTSGIITTVVGNGFGFFSGDGGIPSSAQVNKPLGLAIYGSGSLYISDGSNNRIRKISLTNSAVAPISGTASLCQGVPVLFTDITSGGTWTSSNTTFATVGSSSGMVTGVAAGTATISYSRAMQCGTVNALSPVTVNAFSAGTISGPSIVCPGNTITLTDATTGGAWSSSDPSIASVSGGVVTGAAVGNATISYTISNSCGTIAARQQIMVGVPVITTFAGTGASGSGGDGGPATAATFSTVHSIIQDGAGNFYVTDLGNHKIRKIDPSGTVTTIAGTGVAGSFGEGVPATTATMQNPFNVVFDALGNLYFSDLNNNKIRQISTSGIITTFAGTGTAGFFGDGGPATAAQLNGPSGLAFDQAGNLYVGDFSNNRVRKINTAGVISTIAGTGFAGSSGDNGPATAALLHAPNFIVADGSGNIYFVDNSNNKVRMINSLGIITTVAGTGVSGSLGDGGAATAAQLSFPGGLALDGAGNLYIAGDGNQKVRMVNTATGIISTYAGTGTSGYSGDNGPPLGAKLNIPVDVNFDSQGNLYIADQNNNAIRKIAPVSVSVAPTAGPSTVCVGSTITLTDATSAGTWSSSIPAVGTVGSLSGIVTGVSGGVTNISYSVGYACGTIVQSQPVTVNALPGVPGPIPGPTSQCLGAVTTLTDGTPGGTWTSTVPAVATIGSSSGSLAGVTVGITTISYTISTACGSNSVFRPDTILSAPGPITGTPTVCTGFTTLLGNTTAGGTWTSSNPGVATVGSASGLVSGLTPGVTTITYTVSGICAASVVVTVSQTPAAITPATPVSMCVGATVALSDATFGYTWSSEDDAIATVDVSGNVTGVSAGTVNISYTTGAGCAAVKSVTVLPTPAALSPSSAVICTGFNTTLTESVGGGVWSSSAAGVASVAGGVVSGLSVGTATISYAIGACYVTAPVTVNLSPSPGFVSGPATICTGTPATYTDGVAGGVWSTSNPAIATISPTGVATGVSGGFVTISYTITNSCGSLAATQLVNVVVAPIPGTIIGTSLVCAGGTTTYVDTMVGGTWSMTNGSAIISSTGVLNALTPGTDTVLYTITNFCGSVSAMKVVNIGFFLSAGSISGPSTVCTGSSITLTDGTTGGVWSSSSSAATVGSTGIVTGVSAGVTTISYTVTSGCGSVSTTQDVTVNPTPVSGSVSGPAILCAGMSATYTDPSPGGTWTTTNATASITSGGLLTALSAGIDTIQYTVSNSCGTVVSTAYLTIGPGISAGTISGTTIVCVGATITLTDGAPGGVWGASNSNAIVLGGVVTGVTAGADTISYTVTSSCGSVSASQVVTVNPLPSAGSIAGPSALCLGTTATYTDGVAGGIWSSSNSSATITTGGFVTPVAVGIDTISYTVLGSCGTATATAVISIGIAPTAGTISGPSNVCIGSSVTLTDATPGGSWSASNSHATVAGGVVTGVSAGLVTISYTVTSSCGTAVATQVVDVNNTPSPGVISGPSGVCIGTLATLTETVTGGAWSASNTNATISIGGVVTGITPGTDTISYTVTNACGSFATTHIMSVNTTATAGVITGPSIVCAGGTITLSDAVPGGVWSASNSNATVSTTGVVTGVTTGTDVISYTVTNSCGTATATAAITIGAALSAGTIAGPSAVCIGSSITLTDAAPGGVWSSANSNASVSGGIVTGVAVGTDDISYTVTGSCGSVSAVHTITISNAPDAGAITGPTGVCAGASITLTDAATGGVWSATNTHASVSTGGLVTGVIAGLDTIKYTVTNACGSAVASRAIAVNAAPSAGSIGGPTSVCPAASITLSHSVSGGSWSSSNPAVATVNTAGVVTGVATGTTTISYTVSNTCGHASATYGITVPDGATCEGTAVNGPVGNTKEELQLAPNPNHGAFTLNIVSATDEEVHVVITNVLGEKMKEFTTTTNKVVNVEMNEAAGIYLLNATTIHGSQAAKVIIN